jgi:arylsulfatase A-like enzyme
VNRGVFRIGCLTANLIFAAGLDAKAVERPNVVLIVADDLGYGELTCQGQTRDIPTPRIDEIARGGVRFTSGYVSCPVCSPTRAGLMTGRYQQRFGHVFNPGPVQAADPHFGLRDSETTLPERLRPLGYVTGMVGKWHLGYGPDSTPTIRGFDEFFGFLGGGHSYILGSRPRDRDSILRGSEPVEEQAYLTGAFAREAVAFIDRHKDEPFFLYLPFNAVHNPLQATDADLERFPSISDTKRRTFAAMMASMDDAVGLVLDALRTAKIEERTLIVFISDNGGPTPQTTSRNDPLRGFKGQILEGGIRVPFMIQWAGHLPAGRVDDRPVIALDLVPTIVAAAGGTIPEDSEIDGVNLIPFLTGEKTGNPHESLFWRFGEQWAVRQGDWKLAAPRGESPQLYNLRDDVGESRDLSGEHPEKLSALKAAYQEWDIKNIEPRWSRVRRARRAAVRSQ